MLALLFTQMITENIPVIEYINNAKALWKEITTSPEFKDKEKLAKILHTKQDLFEQNCGGNPIGKIIFPLVGIGLYFDYNISQDSINDGGITDKEIALKIVSAFKNSSVSQETKFTVDQLEVIYGLKELDN